MQIGRRDFIAGMAVAGTGLAIGPAQAAAFPAQDISFIIPFAAGGGFDQYIRAIMPAMKAELPASINVLPNNITGAAGARGVNQLYHAKPDGYTICIINTPGIILMQAQGLLGFDPAELTWLCNMGSDAYGLAVRKDSPLKTVDDLRALAKKGPVKFTGDGPGGTSYTATHIFAHLFDFESQVITGYKGSSDYIVAAMRGDGDATIGALSTLSPFIESGMMRLLVSFEEHSSYPGAADATTLKQPDLTKITVLRMVAGPPKMKPDVANQLSNYLVTAMKDPKVIAWAKANHANLQPSDADGAKKLYHEQAAFIASVQKFIK
jgi:tripartite-type tricarboxylate transporter receptor subunit TctC